MKRSTLIAVGALALSVFSFQSLAQSKSNPTPEIPGYTLGSKKLAQSPVSLDDLAKIKQALLFGDEDTKYLRMAGEIMVPQTEQILDVWYGFVGSHPFLAYYFSDKKTGDLNPEYLARVRARFGRWIKDTTDANYDQAWLNYQHEIGLRHTKQAKNQTDNVLSVDQVNFRYLTAFIVPITATVEPFLAKSGKSPDEVRKMMAAWNKAVTLQVILWSHPYIKDGPF